jgi:hypothetical protein
VRRLDLLSPRLNPKRNDATRICEKEEEEKMLLVPLLSAIRIRKQPTSSQCEIDKGDPGSPAMT